MHRFIKLFGPELSVPTQPAAAAKIGRALDPEHLPEESSFAFIMHELAEQATLPALFGAAQGLSPDSRMAEHSPEKHLAAAQTAQKSALDGKSGVKKPNGLTFTSGLQPSGWQRAGALASPGSAHLFASQSLSRPVPRTAVAGFSQLPSSRFQPAGALADKKARIPAEQRAVAERPGRQAEFSVQQDQPLLKAGAQPAMTAASTEHTLTGNQAAMEQSSNLLSTVTANPQGPGFTLTPSLATAPAGGAPLQAEVPLHLSHPQWGERVGQSLVHFTQQAGSGIHSAQLRLDPPHLGPIQISLHIVDEGLVNAQFFSPHAQVRQSIEQALPHLLEQFNQAGLSLGQTHVGSEQQGHSPADGFATLAQTPGMSSGSASDSADAEPVTARSRSLTHSSTHIIDTFA